MGTSYIDIFFRPVLIVSLAFNMFGTSLQAQETLTTKYPNNLFVGINGTVIPLNYDDLYEPFIFVAGVINIYASVDISKRFAIGLEHKSLRAGIVYNSFDSYMLNGAFLQFNIINSDDARLFFRLYANSGNYCMCGRLPDLPYRQNDLYYWGWGMESNIPIWQNLFIDLGVKSNYIINKPEGVNTIALPQFTIGLSYRFLLRPREDALRA